MLQWPGEKTRSLVMPKSRIFFYFSLAFIGGIFVDSFFYLSQPVILGFLILGILLISLFWKEKKLVVVGFSLLILISGAWHHQRAVAKIVYPQEEKIIFIGQVIKEPDFRSNHLKLTIVSKEIKGKVLVTTERYPEYQYGDQLKISGWLRKPPEFEDFNYRDYLAKEGIYSVIYQPKIELLKRENYRDITSLIYAKILDFKNKLKESIYQNLSPPQSSILGAIILGDKRKISADFREKLNIAGVRHITAISGMHIMILAGILMYLGMILKLRPGKAFYFAVIFLGLYIIAVGLPASAVRAGIMGGLFLLAQKLGRLKSAPRAMVFAASGMLALNPLLLKLDLGFQLSFLAVMGILYLMPSFQNWLKFLPNSETFPFRNLLAVTLAAQIFTLPILIYNFGYISLVAPLVNILVVPGLPFIMILGFLLALAGLIWSPLGWIFSWPTWLLLTYLIKIIDWFSSFSFASLAIENFHWAWLIVAYLVLGYFTYRLNKKEREKFLKHF